MASLIDRHAGKIVGVLSCFDRVVIQGTIPSVCHAKAVETLLHAREIRMFDYGPLFADPFRQAIRAHVDRLAAAEGIEVEYIKKPKGYRKEDRIREIIASVMSRLNSWVKLFEVDARIRGPELPVDVSV